MDYSLLGNNVLKDHRQPVSKPAPRDDRDSSAPDPNAPASPTDQVPLTTWIHPELASLPVFVRAGAILPIAPLMQSTNEIPQGPLTLRVYSGDGCAGHLYLDDGKTYAYKTGVNLRMDFRCEVNADRLLLRLGEHKGSYPAWWRGIRVEIFGWSPRGWSPRKRAVRLNGRNIDANLNLSPDKVAITVPDDGRGEVLEIE